jgi:large repetitive protein
MVIFASCSCSLVASAQAGGSIPNGQNFGQVVVGAAPVSRTITSTLVTSGGSIPLVTLADGVEYSIASSSCTVSAATTCSATVSFKPGFAGPRQDALIIKSSAGQPLATTLLYGIGLGAQPLLLPGIMGTVAGNGIWGFSGDGSVATGATLRNPQGVTVDRAGNIYIADSINQVIRQVNAKTNMISTVAGMALVAGYYGDGGNATRAYLNSPTAIALDGAGNLFIVDQGNNVIRKVDAITRVITTVAGGGGSSGPDG